jgi:hypothetical protein
MTSKMLKRPTPDTGAFFKLHKLLEERKLKRPIRFAVVVFGLLEKPENDVHGIFWVCDVFDIYNDAQDFVDEIIEKTGMTHVKILPLGTSDLLSLNVDTNKTRIIEDIERQNIKERLKEKEDQARINKILTEERSQLKDVQSEVYYGHVWMKYIQNRCMREQTEVTLRVYLDLENERKEELQMLQLQHSEYEKTWFSIFSKYRLELNERAVSDQIELLWKKYQKDVFPF